MNPHFIFNSLSSIQYLVLKNEQQHAFNYLSTFAVLLRHTMEYANVTEVTLLEEIKMIDSYLQLESLRFDNNFRYTIVNEVDDITSKIPPLIIQPIIENALVHGLMSRQGERNLRISFEKKNNQLVCEIADNGIGRAEAIKNKIRKGLTTQSMGLRLSQERLAIFNHSIKKDSISVEDLYDPKGNASGTKVTLTFKYGNKSDHRG